MKKIEFEVPDYMLTLPEKELKKLKSKFLIISIKDRIEVLNEEVKKAKHMLSKYQEKYETSFENFEKTGLDMVSSLEDHEDYMDWFFWHNVYEKSQKELKKYSLFIGSQVQ